MTGGRLKRISAHLERDDIFCATYGDGVADVDIAASIAFHKKHGKLATIAAVRPPARFGALELEPSPTVVVLSKKSRWATTPLSMVAFSY